MKHYITSKVLKFADYWARVVIGTLLAVIIGCVLMLIIPLALMFIGNLMGYPQYQNVLGNIGLGIGVVIICILTWKDR